MSVKAKFEVENKRPLYEGAAPSEGAKITMTAIYKDGSNVDWSKWTPCGLIEMTITNPPAADFFEVGKIVSVTFADEE